MSAAKPPATTITLASLQADLLCRLASRSATADPDSVSQRNAVLRELVTVLGSARELGHVCVDLASWVDEPVQPEEPRRPELAELRDLLFATGVVCTGTPGEPACPLVLDDQHRLYTLRHYQAEQQIAKFVQQRLSHQPLTTPAKLRQTLQELDLLPAATDQSDEPDWQLAAVVAGASQSITVICGGPGTGKTTTVAKLMSVLLHDNAKLRVAVAAPTGKAAARLGEALQERAAMQPSMATSLANLEPRTLHRLLGYLPLDDAFRIGRDKPLPYDLVVVDEVSMVDPAIFAKLCEALLPTTRLILVGDKDQLAAVAAGQVLGDLCHAAKPEQGMGEQLAAFVHEATGMQGTVQCNSAPIANATVALWQNHRFGSQPGIGAFAQALMQRQPERALTALRHGHDDLRLQATAERALVEVLPVLLEQLLAAEQNDSAAALASIGQARILTAQRHGPTGAAAWNARVEAELLERGHRTDEPYYPGCPILITSNDQNNRIWNGDLGVCGRNAQGAPVVWIRDQNGNTRELSPRRLPSHETAWAMTVHKAQGSEFQTVLLALPDRPGPLVHASLIYTGITRAQRRAIVCADEDLLAAGLSLWPQRRSGLADALRSK